MPKRKSTEAAADLTDSTPRKTRRTSAKKDNEGPPEPPSQAETPSGRKSILKGTPTKANGYTSTEATPKSLRKVLFSTPSRPADIAEEPEGEETPTATRNDRSARKKSARALQKQREEEDGSEDEEETGQEAELARQILDEEDEESAEEDIGEAIDVATTPASSTAGTPSKRGRGRPKGPQRQRTPSPPPDLPPHELYFFQNRAGGNKTSANTLPSNLLLHHEDYFTHITAHTDTHAADIERLAALHKRAFEQWIFELEEGFSLCFYGYGSKRKLVMDFAEHMYVQVEGRVRIVVVNGYTPGLTVRDILTTLAGVVAGKGVKLPAQPGAMLDLLLGHLNEHPPKVPIRLVIHSLDHQNLRKQQALIARLAASRHVALLATVDNPNFALLWDTGLLRQFRWLYHDATTFQPYTAEIDVVDSVNELLGRSGRRLGGKDGVAFVLKSLPENARALFRILVAEQLASDLAHPAPFTDADEENEEDILGNSDDERALDELQQQADTPSRRGRGRPAKKPKPALPKAAKQARPAEGVEYRTLYHKAVEEFVCTSELNFRTLLKEFYDHQMVESRRDGVGGEMLRVPFERGELEGILEEIT